MRRIRYTGRAVFAARGPSVWREKIIFFGKTFDKGEFQAVYTNRFFLKVVGSRFKARDFARLAGRSAPGPTPG